MASPELVVSCDKISKASNYCRVCGTSNSYQMSIFNGEGPEHDLAMKINKYLPIQVCETDTFPLTICCQCASSLISWHQLVIGCVKANEMFKKQAAQLDDPELEDKKVVENESEREGNKSKDKELTCPTVAAGNVQDSIKLEGGIQELNCNERLNEGEKSFLLEAKSPENFIESKRDSHETVGEINSSNSFDYYTIFFKPEENGPEYYLCDVREVQNKIQISENVKCTVVNRNGKSDESNLNKDLVARNTYTSENIFPLESNQYQKYIWKCVHKFGKLINNCRSKRILINNSVSCTYCKKKFQNKSVLITHTRTHTGSTPFYCKFCGQSFYLSSALKQHLLNCDKKTEINISTNCNNNTLKCMICCKTFKLKHSLKEHLKKHAGNQVQKLKCNICGSKFHKKAEIIDHLKSHYGESLLKCETCDKLCINKKDLQNHQVSHTSERPYKCDRCGATYKRKSHLSRHLMKQRSNESCRPHSIRNPPGQTFVCEICGKVSATKSLMLLHKGSHTGERKYQCPLCKKRFAQSGAMSRHIHTVHRGARDFSCEICGQKFTAKSTKLNHMRIHTGEKPFQCTTCGKTFRTQQQAKIHEKIHSDMRPYACNYCPKTFRRRPHLVVHIRTHTGEKPYNCPLCTRGFARKNDMTKHIGVHNK